MPISGMKRGVGGGLFCGTVSIGIAQFWQHSSGILGRHDGVLEFPPRCWPLADEMYGVERFVANEALVRGMVAM